MHASNNPFRSECVEQLRYRLDEQEWHALLQRLAGLNYRAALTGPCGSGKTTLLHELQERLEQVGWRTALVRLREESRPEQTRRLAAWYASAAPNTLLLCDSAGQLGWLTWLAVRRAAARCAGLITTQHQPGRLPIVHHCAVTPELFADLVQELLRGIGPERCNEHAWRPALDHLFNHHQGNLRHALGELYHHWAATTCAEEFQRETPERILRKS